MRLINLTAKHHSDVFICTNYCIAKGLREALKIKEILEIPLITIDSEDISFQGFGELQHFVYRPARKLGYEAGSLLIDNIKNKKVFTPRKKIIQYLEIKEEMNLKYMGIHRKKNDNLILYLLDDDSTKTIISLLPNFKRHLHEKIEIEYKLFNYENLYENIIKLSSNKLENENLPDIIMIDNPWLPDFVNADLLINLNPIINEIGNI